MTKVFLSATRSDLGDHRAAVIDRLTRMGHRPVTMEDFGSRPGTVREVCRAAVADCGLFVGVFGWHYGSRMPGSVVSYTEGEFDVAEELGLPMLLYLADPDYRPAGIAEEAGDDRAALERLKRDKVGRYMRSKFTTPNDLAASVTADVARELARMEKPTRGGSGGQLSENWPVLEREARLALMEAFAHARERGKGHVSTEDVLVMLTRMPSTAGMLMNWLPKEGFKAEKPVVAEKPPLEDALTFEGEYSHCVNSTLRRLAAEHSPDQPIRAIDVAADLLINGRGSSVVKFRNAGVTADVVNSMMRRASAVAEDAGKLRAELEALSAEDLAAVGYALDLNTTEPGFRDDPVAALMAVTGDRDRRSKLLGEVLRRQPRALGDALVAAE